MTTALFMALALSAPAAEPTEEAWGVVGDRLLVALKAGNVASIRAEEPRLGPRLLAQPPKRAQYLPAICIARSLDDARAIPYYERALRLRALDQNVQLYVEASIRLDRMSEAAAFLEAAKVAAPRGEATLSIARGDAAYLAGDRVAARAHYDRAARMTWPPGEDEMARLRGNAAALGAEYTYARLYASPEGAVAWRGVRSFLPVKRRLCDLLPRREDAMRYTVAVLVVRRTDLDYVADGQPHHEALTLSDADLDRHRAAWKFATDAVQLFSEGRLVVESDWIELTGVTVTGLTDHLWKGIVRQRHLDPARLEPRPDDALREAVRTHDAVVFVWPGGRAAAAYGGGSLRLPRSSGERLPARGGILRMPEDPSSCLHELLHGFEGRVAIPRVHGPEDHATLAQFGIGDELAWYEHLIRSIPDVRTLRYRETF